MNNNLYCLTNEYESLYERMIETGEISTALTERLSAVGKSFEEKALSCACVSKMLDNDIKILLREQGDKL